MWRERCSNDNKPRTATILAHAMVKSGMKQLVGDSILQLGKHMTRWLVVLFQGGRCKSCASEAGNGEGAS